MNTVRALNDVEAAKLAVTVEKIGFAFYTEVARSATNRKTERVFKMLAQQEEVHRNRFETLAASLVARRVEFWDDPSIEAYIRALVETGIFPDVDTAHALAQAIEGESDAFRLALKIEKDSVLFYTQAARTARSKEAAQTFSDVAEEEKKHVVTVQSFLAKPNAGG